MGIKQKTYAGIDIGGSSVKYGWGSINSGLVQFYREELIANTLQSLKQTIGKALKTIDKELGWDNISAIGGGFPGTLDKQTGRLVGVNPNLPELTDIKPGALFPEHIRKKLYIQNDANLMTLGEFILHPGKNFVIGITIGSGLGCGFVQAGVIYDGAHGYAMELGHIIVEQNGLKCSCGKHGCLEAYASVKGLLKQIQAKKGYKSLNIEELLSQARSNPEIKEIIQRSVENLSNAIANLVIVLDPDLIVLGGGAVEIKGYPVDRIIKGVMQKLPLNQKAKIEICRAKLGNQAGVWGGIVFSETKQNLN